MVKRNAPTDFPREAIVRAARDGTFEQLAQRAGLDLEGDAWKAVAQDVAELHRARKIDIVGCAARSQDTVGHFAGMLYAAVVRDTDPDFPTFLKLVGHLSARGLDNSIPYFLFDLIADWAALDEVRVSRLIAEIRAGNLPADFLIATLQAGLRADRAAYIPVLTDMLVCGPDNETSASGFVLGGLKAENPNEGRTMGDAIRSALQGPAAANQVAAFGAALAIGTRAGGDEAIAVAAINSFIGRSDATIRQSAARALFLAHADLSPALVAQICDLLGGVERGEAQTIAAIDTALSHHLSGPSAAPRIGLFTDLLKRELASLRELDNTARHVLVSKDGLAGRVMAAWIASGSDALIRAVHDLVMIPASDQPVFDLDFTPFALTAEQTAVAGRKIVASLILFPEATASILLSLMRTGNDAAADELEGLLFNPLLISYWEEPRAYLDRVAPSQSEDIQHRIEHVVAKLDAYVGKIRDTGVIRELRPSDRQLFQRQLFRSEERLGMQKSVERKSIFADLFPKSVVLYGDSVVSEVYRADGQSERQEFKMGVVEHSVPLARLDAIDPFGFWYQRAVLSMGKKP